MFLNFLQSNTSYRNTKIQILDSRDTKKKKSSKCSEFLLTRTSCQPRFSKRISEKYYSRGHFFRKRYSEEYKVTTFLKRLLLEYTLEFVVPSHKDG